MQSEVIVDSIGQSRDLAVWRLSTGGHRIPGRIQRVIFPLISDSARERLHSKTLVFEYSFFLNLKKVKYIAFTDKKDQNRQTKFTDKRQVLPLQELQPMFSQLWIPYRFRLGT